MKFLIDECLHTSLVAVANEAGHEAHHVVYGGWAGFEDHALRAIILRDEFVFVTNNGRDFLGLLGQVDLQPGLMIIVPNEKPVVQRKLFGAALKSIMGLRNLVNKVVEIHSVSDIAISELPKPE